MKEFLDIYEKHKAMGEPNFYILASFFQGLVALEALNRAIEQDQVTREGFVAALKTVQGYDAGGLAQPIDLSKFPYVTSTRTRVLKPRLAEKSWEVAAPFADPKSLAAK
jgi:hypothetical protein